MKEMGLGRGERGWTNSAGREESERSEGEATKKVDEWREQRGRGRNNHFPDCLFVYYKTCINCYAIKLMTLRGYW